MIVMATSSITKNFVISDPQHVEMFANAIELATTKEYASSSIKFTQLNDDKSIDDFLTRRKQVHG